MLDIYNEIRALVYRRGTSLTKMLADLRAKGIKVAEQKNFAYKCRQRTIKFEEVQQILDYLGYELIIKEKQ